MGAVHHRTDQLSSIATAKQTIATCAPIAAKSDRISDPEELGRNHRARPVQSLHGSPAFVDASVVRPRRQDLGASRMRRQRKLVSGLL